MTQRSTTTPKQRVRNRLVIFFHRVGLPFGPMQLLTVPGRVSGVPRTTPVAPVLLDGVPYLCQAYPHADWVKNARAAGRGRLTRGRTSREVDLVELDETERAVVLREFPGQNPRGAGAFLRNGIVRDASPEAFAAAAASVPVFRATVRGAGHQEASA